MPGGQGQFSSRLEYSQHLSNSLNRRWKEHHPEAAHHSIEHIRGKRQVVGRGDFELCIAEPKMVSRSTSGVHHLRRRIHPEHFALGADKGSYGQGRLSGPGSNIQNCVSAANRPMVDESFGDRGKHLPDDFAVLLPERRGSTPSAYHLLVGLHEQVSWPSPVLTGFR